LLAAGRAVRDQIRRRTQANLDVLRTALDHRSACRALQVEGGWSAVVRVPRILSEEDWTLTLLNDDG